MPIDQLDYLYRCKQLIRLIQSNLWRIKVNDERSYKSLVNASNLLTELDVWIARNTDIDFSKYVRDCTINGC